ncbi:hypothetical protein BWL13_00611 [Microbacterium oleivorans]|uniref:hypothetical protein n=1 Tax=Microbacterium oleivorans TaxID=273677 RepID=UPI000F8F8EA0|nr:hypothetical protein [Microbacterium oleivorans]AZS43069.1 hypothetical protein BWL13_00611 [Microbacterium oleivorans]
MTFPVGSTERHTVVFSFDKFWGRLTITVDGQSVVDSVQMFSMSTVKTWAFFVGHQERHSVRMEKHRTVFFAGFRSQPVYAFIDDVLVAQGVA